MLQKSPSQTDVPDHALGPKSRLGIRLFWVYSLIYAGFVAVNTVDPRLMEAEPFLGLNLAILYGFGLIVFAIALGVAYNARCTGMEDRLNVVSAVPGEEEGK